MWMHSPITKVYNLCLVRKSLISNRKVVRDTQGFDLSILYYSCKANVVVDYLRRLFMDCTIHFGEGKNELAQEVHRHAQLGV